MTFALVPTLIFAVFGLTSFVNNANELQIISLEELAETSASACEEMLDIHKAEILAKLNGQLVTYFKILNNTDQDSNLHKETYEEGVEYIDILILSLILST